MFELSLEACRFTVNYLTLHNRLPPPPRGGGGGVVSNIDKLVRGTPSEGVNHMKGYTI